MKFQGNNRECSYIYLLIEEILHFIYYLDQSLALIITTNRFLSINMKSNKLIHIFKIVEEMDYMN